MSTLLRPNEGEVSIFGEDIAKMDASRLSSIKRDSLGLVFQQHYLFRGFSVTENLEVAAMLAEEDLDEDLLVKLKIDCLWMSLPET